MTTGGTSRTGAVLWTLAVSAMCLSAVVARSSASSVPAPVSVRTCDVDTSYVALNPFYGPAQQRAGTSVRLAFVNNNSIAAKDVLFIVTEGGYKQHITIDGHFARGITIDRTVIEDSGANGNESATCTVAKIDFVDGSSWSADRSPS